MQSLANARRAELERELRNERRSAAMLDRAQKRAAIDAKTNELRDKVARERAIEKHSLFKAIAARETGHDAALVNACLRQMNRLKSEFGF